MIPALYKKLVDGIKVRGTNPASGESVELTAVQDANGGWVLRTVDAAPFAYDTVDDLLKVNIQKRKYSKLIKEHKEFLWTAGQNTIRIGKNVTGITGFIPLDVSDYKEKVIIIKNNFTVAGNPKSIKYRIGAYVSLPTGQVADFDLTADTVLEASQSVILDSITIPKLSLPIVGLSVILVVNQFTADRPDGGNATIQILGGAS